MPRTARLDAPGVLHHVIIRGIERRKIFRNNKDRMGISGRTKASGCNKKGFKESRGSIITDNQQEGRILMERRDFFKAALAGLSTIALADNAYALRYYPQESDKKWAVLYGTWFGSSRDAAIWISEGMGGIADVFDVRENPDLKGFDHLVVGGSIRGGKTRQELIDYMEKNRDWMKERIRGIFAVCHGTKGDMDQKKTDYVDNHIAKICGVSDVPSRLFPGRFTAALLGPELTKANAKMGITGDIDDLKRSDCLEFGREILSTVQAD
jgi:hypothetical protein